MGKLKDIKDFYVSQITHIDGGIITERRTFDQSGNETTWTTHSTTQQRYEQGSGMASARRVSHPIHHVERQNLNG